MGKGQTISEVNVIDPRSSITEFENLWTAWKGCERNLEELATREDELLNQGHKVPDNIDDEINEQFLLQSDIIIQLLSARSTTPTEVCTKLNVWAARRFDGTVNFNNLAPADRLVCQAIRELNSLCRTENNS